VAVWGSLKERLSLLNGTWVSPGVVVCHGTVYNVMHGKKQQQRVGWESSFNFVIDKKKKAMRTKTVEENEEILIGSIVAWRIAERRRDG
jgi:hypothetical protein